MIPGQVTDWRLFFALELPNRLRVRLREVAGRFQGVDRGVRWVQPENLHLTLRFLGDVPRDAVEPFQEALAPLATHGPIPLNVTGLDAFRKAGKLTVIFAALDEPLEPLQAMASEADRIARDLGLPPEPLTFRPHITLGRVGKGAGHRKLDARFEKVQLEPLASTAESVALLRSVLRRDHPVYHCVQRVRLSAAGDDAGSGRIGG